MPARGWDADVLQFPCTVYTVVLEQDVKSVKLASIKLLYHVPNYWGVDYVNVVSKS